MAEKALTTFQAAKLCGVFPTTVINWVNLGKLRAYKTPGGHRRIIMSEFFDFLRRYGMPIPPELSGARQPRQKILIVDDDMSMTKMLKKAFLKLAKNIEPRTANGGIEALVQVGQWDPDLVILDVVMPVVDGVKVCASLRSDPQTSRIKIIAISGKKLPESAKQFLKKHVDAFFEKPFDILKVVETAKQLLHVQEVAV